MRTGDQSTTVLVDIAPHLGCPVLSTSVNGMAQEGPTLRSYRFGFMVDYEENHNYGFFS